MSAVKQVIILLMTVNASDVLMVNMLLRKALPLVVFAVVVTKLFLIPLDVQSVLLVPFQLMEAIVNLVH